MNTELLQFTVQTNISHLASHIPILFSIRHRPRINSSPRHAPARALPPHAASDRPYPPDSAPSHPPPRGQASVRGSSSQGQNVEHRPRVSSADAEGRCGADAVFGAPGGSAGPR
jgi:hypothetical protein